ncbi:type II secretion system minor pseudopilin GspK [Ottowia testudinis]|uniref:Type II secretion system protein K n=1 Tax=Ottowia testudinis TaxID=2816950 RepID=A0A975CIJ4_9BURK|nr:type II secretion system minor pseudopilin GspK [Ottowia testudinis]QTD46224.1 type II secretion system minor pseudopilin GspK [Ottowia testudinis]
MSGATGVRAPGRCGGAALLAAMITVALVATLAAGALWRQWRGVEVEAAERARVQSAWLLSGALDWSRLILSGDLSEDQKRQRNSNEPLTDHLGEPWAVPLAEARLSSFLAAGESSTDTDREAFLSGQIVDLQSRLNVMNLAARDKRKALERFDRLFSLLGLPSTELGALQRNLTRAQAAMSGGGDGTDAPLMPRRFEQLAWLGLAPATLEQLRPYVTLLPTQGDAPTPVNLNTASAEVIYAAVPGLDLSGAQRLVSERERAYLKDPAAAVTSVAPSGQALDTSWTAVASAFFQVRARLRLDQVALEEESAVRRDAPQRVVPLWRERTALSVQAPR